jgi:hypothetical protein
VSVVCSILVSFKGAGFDPPYSSLLINWAVVIPTEESRLLRLEAEGSLQHVHTK